MNILDDFISQNMYNFFAIKQLRFFRMYFTIGTNGDLNGGIAMQER